MAARFRKGDLIVSTTKNCNGDGSYSEKPIMYLYEDADTIYYKWKPSRHGNDWTNEIHQITRREYESWNFILYSILRGRDQ
jgi:hypothetical protein